MVWDAYKYPQLNRDENDVDVKNGKVVGSIQNVDGSKKEKSN